MNDNRLTARDGQGASVKGGGSFPGLENALMKCVGEARRGYEIAMVNLERNNKATLAASSKLAASIRDIESLPLSDQATSEQLKGQLDKMKEELNALNRNSAMELEQRYHRLHQFSISLFGRTMAGKSTLMEILTRGNGESIGKGAQRTTRDVRSYSWNGLEVTDVPGSGAFEGSEDTRLAMGAADRADLVLFLITDDAPKAFEAECLANIKRLGKPVIGICNVKHELGGPEDADLFLATIDRRFDKQRVKDLVLQFNEFIRSYIPGEKIPFVVTHLLSRYLADRPGYERRSDQLVRKSYFDNVEKTIVAMIEEQGPFLRLKSFIDLSVSRMVQLTDEFFAFSQNNSSRGRVVLDRIREVSAWAEAFRASGEVRIRAEIRKAADSLRAEVSDFADDHYEDSDAQDAWMRVEARKDVAGAAKRVQETLVAECRDKLTEIARKMDSELTFIDTFGNESNIGMDKIFNTRKLWNIGTAVVSGIVSVASLFFAAPLGLIAAGIHIIGSIISFFFDDQDDEIRKARQKLAKQLKRRVDSLEKELVRSSLDWFFGQLMNHVALYRNDLKTLNTSLFKLADAQRGLALDLNGQLKDLSRTLVLEALSRLGEPGAYAMIKDVARVPGSAAMLLVAPGTRFPAHARYALSRTLGEPVFFAVDTGDMYRILRSALWRSTEGKISPEPKLNLAHVPTEGLNAEARVRIKLAQQLTGIHVVSSDAGGKHAK
ncbi:MAG: 50S ribosome-binding GTPase [Deltaproteobacteria bacterium]|nr:50S ribosome-binding GTPase [Deltaproteobacteria bacterium]